MTLNRIKELAAKINETAGLRDFAIRKSAEYGVAGNAMKEMEYMNTAMAMNKLIDIYSDEMAELEKKKK